MANLYGWRVATRVKGQDKWHIAKAHMTAHNARSVAKQLNVVYPENEHQAVQAKDYPNA